MRHTLQQFVTAIAEGRFGDVELEAPLWSPDARDSLARHTLRNGRRPPWSDPRQVALNNRYRLLPRAPRGVCGEAVVPGIIAYDGSAEPKLRGLLVAHGLVHQRLLTQPEASNEADAWLATFGIVLSPGDIYLLSDDEVVALAHAPEWAVRLALRSLRPCFPGERHESFRIYPSGLTL